MQLEVSVWDKCSVDGGLDIDGRLCATWCREKSDRIVHRDDVLESGQAMIVYLHVPKTASFMLHGKLL